MEHRAKAELVEISRKLHAQGWVANHDGNVSVRTSPDRIWATPTGVSKADVDLEMLVCVDLTGKRTAGRLRPFSEINLHLASYRARPDVRAVVHAHPPIATGFACAGVSLPVAMMPEVVVSIGPEIPTAPYAPPGPAAAAAVEAMVPGYHAFLLASHGALTVGTTLEQAYLRMELVEHYARIARSAMALGGPVRLPAADVERLLAARKKAGLEPPEATPPPGTSSSHAAAVSRARVSAISQADQSLARVLAEEISAAMKGR